LGHETSGAICGRPTGSLINGAILVAKIPPAPTILAKMVAGTLLDPLAAIRGNGRAPSAFEVTPTSGASAT
jgi:hypothetical protein